MAGQLTLAIIKPHAVLERNVGKILTEIENRDFAIVLAKMVQMSRHGAEEFYQEHKGKDFFENLVNETSRSPVWVLALAKPNAVEEWRNHIGATRWPDAAEGSIRKMFADHDITVNNAVHGSATDHAAKDEITFFFAKEIEIAGRINSIDPAPIL